MASHVVVIDTSARRATIKVTPVKPLSEVLEEACAKLGYTASQYTLKYVHVEFPSARLRGPGISSRGCTNTTSDITTSLLTFLEQYDSLVSHLAPNWNSCNSHGLLRSFPLRFNCQSQKHKVSRTQGLPTSFQARQHYGWYCASSRQELQEEEELVLGILQPKAYL